MPIKPAFERFLLVPLFLLLAFRILTALIITEWYDEAWYMAVPFRFVLGDKPFVDEMGIYQLHSLLLFPFVKIYYSLVNDTVAILTVSRILYVLFTLGFGFVTYFCFRPNMSPWRSALLGIAAAAFVPSTVANFGYNSLGAIFWASGMFLSYRGLTIRKESFLLSLAGVSHTLAVLCCPQLIIGWFAHAALCIWFYKPSSKQLLCYLLPQVGIAIIFFIFVSPPALFAEYANQKLLFKHSENTLATRFDLKTILVLFFSGSALYLIRRRPKFLGVVLVSVLIFSAARGLYAIGYEVYFGMLLGTILLLCLRRKPFLDPFSVLFISSLVAALATSYFSSVGNFLPGMIPVFCIALFWLSLFIEESMDGFSAPKVAAVALSFVPIFILFVKESVHLLDYGNLEVRVQQGPFKGLITSTEKKIFLETIWSDVRKIAKETPNARLWVLEFNPYAYLVAPIRPAVPSLYHCVKPSAHCISYLLDKSNEAPVILAKTKLAKTSENWEA